MSSILWFIFDVPCAIYPTPTTMMVRGRQAEAIKECIHIVKSLPINEDSLVRMFFASHLLLSPAGIVLEGGASSDVRNRVSQGEYLSLYDSIQAWLNQFDQSNGHSNEMRERIAEIMIAGKPLALKVLKL